MENGQSPEGLREGVRAGILASVERDVERRGGRTAQLLVAAGAAGVAGAVGATLLVSTHPFGHHPPWHVVLFSTVWAGLLVVSFSIAFLEIRTPSLPLAHSASVALLGLGIAGVCGALCPDHHFLGWWSETRIGRSLGAMGGTTLSALCFGLATTFSIGLVSALCFARGGSRAPLGAVAAAAMLFLLLAPGVALQSFGTSTGVFAGWLSGTAAGAGLGVAGGSCLRGALFARERH